MRKLSAFAAIERKTSKLNHTYEAFDKPPEIKWAFPESFATPQQTEEIAAEYSIPRFIAGILLNRGIEDITGFLSKSKKSIRHPNLLPDIDDAVNRILRAVQKKEKIIVYGDYDVDGMTSTAMMTDFLQSLGADVEYYIPDRVSEGYGLNSAAIERLAKDGVKLIVTVDCGVTSIEESLTAFKNNVDLVITDHHTCLDELPFASAVVNPKRPDSGYGFDGLAGVGVAFKVCLALGLKTNINSNVIFDRYCALAAIGTIADVVPLVDENRVIVAKGLEALSTREFVGIDAILKMLDIDKRNLVSTNISFNIAPKLNAAGRLGDPRTAVGLLMTTDRKTALHTAKELDELNNQRRELETLVFNEIIEYLEKHCYELCERIIVVRGNGWNHGVIGRVAAMVSEKFYRPCIVVSFDGTKGKGSCRGIEGFDMFDALSSCSKYLDDFGGHKAAAGLSVSASEWNNFRTAICQYAKGVFENASDMVKYIHIDGEIFPNEITLSNARMLSILEPFGTENQRPVFYTQGLMIDSISLVGVDSRHVRITFVHNGRRLNAIGFNLARLADKFQAGNTADCVFTLEVNSYNGTDSVQMRLLDMDWSNKYFNE